MIPFFVCLSANNELSEIPVKVTLSDLSYADDLVNPSSSLYQQYAEHVCDEVGLVQDCTNIFTCMCIV